MRRIKPSYSVTVRTHRGDLLTVDYRRGRDGAEGLLEQIEAHGKHPNRRVQYARGSVIELRRHGFAGVLREAFIN